MPKPTDEYGIQQVNAAVVFKNSTDVYVEEFRKPVQEINQVVSSMGSCVVPEEQDYLKPRSLGTKLRAEYREKAFESWKGRMIHGSGVETYEETAVSNDWILSRSPALPINVHLDMVRSRIN